MVGCGNRQTHPQEQCNTVDSTTIKRIVPHGEYNSIYHWKTTFNPINSELAFLRKHNVKRLYLRFFDVALDNHWLEGELYPVPIATTVFRQVPPADMEIVPTVYITLEVLRQTNVKTADLANRIVTRILAMATRHKIGNINEVQFDYDCNNAKQLFRVVPHSQRFIAWQRNRIKFHDPIAPTAGRLPTCRSGRADALQYGCVAQCRNQKLDFGLFRCSPLSDECQLSVTS